MLADDFREFSIKNFLYQARSRLWKLHVRSICVNRDRKYTRSDWTVTSIDKLRTLSLTVVSTDGKFARSKTIAYIVETKREAKGTKQPGTVLKCIFCPNAISE